MMADSNSNALKKELVTSETFMTDEEVKEKNQQKLRELEILKSELNSSKLQNFVIILLQRFEVLVNGN